VLEAIAAYEPGNAFIDFRKRLSILRKIVKRHFPFVSLLARRHLDGVIQIDIREASVGSSRSATGIRLSQGSTLQVRESALAEMRAFRT
jgi:hypothetical protein